MCQTGFNNSSDVFQASLLSTRNLYPRRISKESRKNLERISKESQKNLITISKQFQNTTIPPQRISLKIAKRFKESQSISKHLKESQNISKKNLKQLKK